MNKAKAIPTPAIVTRPPELLSRTSERGAAPWTGVLEAEAAAVDEAAPARAADDAAVPDPEPEVEFLEPEALPPPLPEVEFLLLPPLLVVEPVADPVELFLLPLPLLPVALAAADDAAPLAAWAVSLPPLLCLARMKTSSLSTMAAGWGTYCCAVTATAATLTRVRVEKCIVVLLFSEVMDDGGN